MGNPQLSWDEKHAAACEALEARSIAGASDLNILATLEFTKADLDRKVVHRCPVSVGLGLVESGLVERADFEGKNLWGKSSKGKIQYGVLEDTGKGFSFLVLWTFERTAKVKNPWQLMHASWSGAAKRFGKKRKAAKKPSEPVSLLAGLSKDEKATLVRQLISELRAG